MRPGLFHGRRSERGPRGRAGIEADIGPIAVEWTTFEVALRTARAVDLAVPPFRAHKKHISSPVAYDASQALGRAMRADGVVAFRYVSARDRAGGCNFGVFEPSAFAVRPPSRRANWHCTAVPSRVEIFRKDVLRRETFVFEREEFEVAGRLPAPAL